MQCVKLVTKSKKIKNLMEEYIGLNTDMLQVTMLQAKTRKRRSLEKVYLIERYLGSKGYESMGSNLLLCAEVTLDALPDLALSGAIDGEEP